MKFSSYLIGLLNIVALVQRHKLEKCSDYCFKYLLYQEKKKARRLRTKGGAVCAILDHFCFVGSQKDPGMRKRWVQYSEKSKMVLSFLFSTAVTKFLSGKFKLSQPINFSLFLFFAFLWQLVPQVTVQQVTVQLSWKLKSLVMTGILSIYHGMQLRLEIVTWPTELQPKEVIKPLIWWRQKNSWHYQAWSSWQDMKSKCRLWKITAFLLHQLRSVLSQEVSLHSLELSIAGYKRYLLTN